MIKYDHERVRLTEIKHGKLDELGKQGYLVVAANGNHVFLSKRFDEKEWEAKEGAEKEAIAAEIKAREDAAKAEAKAKVDAEAPKEASQPEVEEKKKGFLRK